MLSLMLLVALFTRPTSQNETNKIKVLFCNEPIFRSNRAACLRGITEQEAIREILLCFEVSNLVKA